tara:strand:- start:329 stop:1069 length:741 start_codon:yes stop_codon:yes gene_type:complete
METKNNQVKVNSVYRTNDYSLFTKLHGNRDVNKTHLNRLKLSIKERSLCVPIIVNEKHQIIDGQHRFTCWKELMLPVYYIVVHGYNLKEVQRLNTNTMNWKLIDYANSYCDLGNLHYRKYKKFKSKYNLGDYESIAMLQGNTKGSGRNFERFRNGLFMVKYWEKACKEAEQINRISEFYDGYKRRSFVFAMLHLLNNDDFNFNQLLRKIKLKRAELFDCTNTEQYILLLNKIYNYGQSKKVNLIYN